MAALATMLPGRRTDLVIRPVGEQGRYVVKDPGTGSYFQLGEQEHFLLSQLDGQQDAAAVCTAFQERFGQPLSEEDLDGFLALARSRDLLDESETGVRRQTRPVPAEAVAVHRPLPPGPPPAADSPPASRAPRRRQSLLYWRKNLVDPDRLFTWLAPRLWCFWTRSFVIVSAASIALAAALLWTGGGELASSFYHALRWDTAALLWLALFTVTMLHESAHGLTCKRHGGEVHEIGFLLMYFMPCFYCNVSDAWLFREKSRRLWVTLAGGYFELFLWSLAVFVWRLTVPASLINHVAFVLLSVCGVRTLFNFNPLLKLDGYYLLSDWLEIPNLRQRSWNYVAAHVRWLLWGASRPAGQERGRLLLGFGLLSWAYSLLFLVLMLWAFFRFAWSSWGWVGLIGIAVLGWLTVGGLFRGFSGGEFRQMLLLRKWRTASWLVLLGAAVPALQLIEMDDRESGPFQVRPAFRSELRAEVAGFLKEVHFEEGDRVPPGGLVARLEVPDLATRIAQKRAEVREARAKLRLLEVGPRPEEVIEQRARVARMKVWRDLAEKDLAQTRQALTEELGRLDKQIAQFQAELNAADEAYRRAQDLLGKQAIAQEAFQEAERKYHVAQSLLAQAQFQKRHREALGTREAIAGLDAEAELARREKDLADAQSILTLLEAGTRAEELEAQQALLERLEEEVGYWEGLQPKLLVICPSGGVVTTPHLTDKIGHYLREGDLICVVEEPSALEVDIALSEQQSARIRPGQTVELKARALPFETIQTTVDRIAPSALRGDPAALPPAAASWNAESTVVVYCRLESSADELRPGTTGYARIQTGRRPIAHITLERVLRYLRTEFWW